MCKFFQISEIAKSTRLFVFFITAFMVISIPSIAQAQDKTFHFQDFERLPILHEGRVKPLQSFAALHYRWYQGESGISHDDAINWLAQTIFDPQGASHYPVFLVRSKELKNSIISELSDKGDDVDTEPKRLFSVSDLMVYFSTKQKAIEKLMTQDEASKGAFDHALEELYKKYISAAALMQSMSLYLPLDVEPPSDVDLSDKSALSLVDIHPHYSRLKAALNQVVKKKKSDIERYTEDEQKLTHLMFAYDQLYSRGQGNDYFKILPDFWGNGSYLTLNWLSPWQQFISSKGHPDHKLYLSLWRDMATAYRSGDVDVFKSASQKAYTFLMEREKDIPVLNAQKLDLKLSVEVLYNVLRPTNVAMIFYLIALTGALLAGISRFGWMGYVSTGAMGVAISFQALALTLRGILLERPPVTTLYESLLFVSLVTALLAFAFFVKSRSQQHIIYGALGAFGLIFTSTVFLADQDSLQMLVAVLNTNFWLATHVLIITLGYGLCVLASLMAHGWFIYGLSSKQEIKEKREKLFKQIYFLSVIALLVTTIGTVLGGIWADQSWGRFWGWDPKENGALLIVLWLAWVIHGRLSSIFSKAGAMFWIGYLNVIVALAWFGVNLLGVGLHSYGFISGIALGLFGFIFCETVLLLGLYYMSKKNN